MEKLLFSNSLETLAKELSFQLFGSQKLLEKHYVVVDSLCMKNYLMEFFAQGEKKICCGVEFIEKERLLSFFENFLEGGSSRAPSYMELFFQVVSHLRFFLSQTEGLCQELHSYFPSKLSKKQRNRRLFSLSSSLTELFLDYSLYGKDIETKWQKSEDWQKKLFYQIFSEKNYATGQKLLSFPIDRKKIFKKSHFHFFSLSYLSPLYHQLIEKFEDVFSFVHYEFSPTPLYWGDESSDRDISYLTKKGYSSRGAKAQFAALESYLYDRNPLVANLGKIGQKYYALLDEKTMEVFEAFDEENSEHGKRSLLQQLQYDIFHLVNPDRKRGLAYDEKDETIQFSVTTTRLREVEVLKEHIFYLMDKKGILPSEILVLAPDMEIYSSAIEQVFDKEGERISFRLSNRDLSGESDYANAMHAFFALVGSRFEKEEIFALFQSKSACLRMEFSNEDLIYLKELIQKANVIWGRDDKHCHEEVEKSTFPFLHTWEKGLERLTLSLATFDQSTHEKKLLLGEVEVADSLLFSKFIRVYEDIVEDITYLSDDPELTLDQWSQYLGKLAGHYFQVVEEDQTEKRAEALFISFLKSLVKAHKGLPEELFSFSLIRPLLEGIFLQKSSVIHSSQWEAVRFHSFTTGSIYPARAICFLGMDEECPGYEEKKDIDLMRREPAEFHERMGKDKRLAYLFLQAICNAKESLYFSYAGISKEDGKLEPPSVFLAELFSYLDRAYDAEILENLQTLHPSFGFHSSYFQKEARCYSKTNYKAALAHYTKETKKEALWDFSFSKSYRSELPQIIQIKDLLKLMKNPLQLFANETLGFYLKEEKSREKEKEALLALSFLDRYQIRKYFRDHSWETLVEQLERRGELPGGMMGEVAKKALEKEYLSSIETLEEWNLKKEDIFSITLQEGCYSPYRMPSGDWIVPPLEVGKESQRRQVVGIIPEVSTKGLLFWGEGQREDRLKVWPLYLCYHLLKEQIGELPHKVLFMKKKKEMDWRVAKPCEYFELLISYYDKALTTPSPLLLPWGESLQKKDLSLFEKKISESFREDIYEDKYLDFILSRISRPSGQTLIEEWGPFLEKTIFSPMEEEENL